VADVKRIACPQCDWRSGKFCNLCGGKGFMEIDPKNYIPEAHGHESPSVAGEMRISGAREVSADMTRTDKPVSELTLQSLMTAVTAIDATKAAALREQALNRAQNVYNICQTGYASKGTMETEEIVPLARQILQFLEGD
jgi:hypothetical protein